MYSAARRNYFRLSVVCLQDHESTEHDGDVEDYSEGENGTTGSEKSHHRLMYYPPPEDIVSNQFTVNAMDVEELRRYVVSRCNVERITQRVICFSLFLHA